MKFLDLTDFDGRALERFRLEARALAALSDPHVLRVFDHGQDGSHPYIVMELAGRGTLGDALSREGAFDVMRAARVALDVARGLEYLHAHDVLHRDIKPHNLFLLDDGRVVLGDFGLALTDDRGTLCTTTGLVVGTPAYLAPELFEGTRFSPSTDMYAFGVTMFELLTGRQPVTGRRKGFYVAQCHKPATPLHAVLPDAPEALAQLVDQLLERDPLTRALTASETRVALEHIVDAAASFAAAPTPAATPQPPRRAEGVTRVARPSVLPRPVERKLGPALLLGAGLLVVGLALASARSPAPPPPPVHEPDPRDALLATLDDLELPRRAELLSRRWRELLQRPESVSGLIRREWVRGAVADLDRLFDAARLRQRLAAFRTSVARHTALDHPLSAADLPLYFALQDLCDLAAAVPEVQGVDGAAPPALDAAFRSPLPAHWTPRHEPLLDDVRACTVLADAGDGFAKSVQPGTYRAHAIARGWRTPIFGDLSTYEHPVDALERLEREQLAAGQLGFTLYEHPGVVLPRTARVRRLEVGLRCRPSKTALFMMKLAPAGQAFRDVALLGRDVPRASNRESVSYFLALDPALVRGADVRMAVELRRLPHVPFNYGARLSWITVRWQEGE